jgi:hypothetical protein
MKLLPFLLLAIFTLLHFSIGMSVKLPKILSYDFISIKFGPLLLHFVWKVEALKEYWLPL